MALAMSPCLPLRSRLSPLAFQLRARSYAYQSRTIVSSSASPSTEPHPDSLNQPQPKRRKPLSPEQRKFLDSALRVNQAGELAATLIYTAQSPPINKAYPHLRALMKHMYDQEAGHFKYFNKVLAEHRIRPTAMYPVWHAAATFLGWATGILGREAAMACTEAVETEIGEHYNGQVRELLAWMKDMEERGEDVGDELRGLIQEIRRIRDEELEHLDHAVENDAKEANPYELLTGVIRSAATINDIDGKLQQLLDMLWDDRDSPDIPYKHFSTWPEVEEETSKDLVLKLIGLDPQSRMTARDALEHPWFAEEATLSDDGS